MADTIYVDDVVVSIDEKDEATRTENVITFEDLKTPKDASIEGGGGAGDIVQRKTHNPNKDGPANPAP